MRLVRGQARLNGQLCQLLGGDELKANEDRRVTIEVRCGEVDARILGEQCLLGSEVLYISGQDRTAGSVVTKSLDSPPRSGRSHANPLSFTRHCRNSRDTRSLVSGMPSAIRRTSAQVAIATP